MCMLFSLTHSRIYASRVVTAIYSITGYNRECWLCIPSPLHISSSMRVICIETWWIQYHQSLTTHLPLRERSAMQLLATIVTAKSIPTNKENAGYTIRSLNITSAEKRKKMRVYILPHYLIRFVECVVLVFTHSWRCSATACVSREEKNIVSVRITF